VDRISISRFADTNALFTPPTNADVHVTSGTPQYWAELIARKLEFAFDPQQPTALFVGRYQPFRAAHGSTISAAPCKYSTAFASVIVGSSLVSMILT